MNRATYSITIAHAWTTSSQASSSPRSKTISDPPVQDRTGPQLADDLGAYPKNDEGGFWHNDGVPRRMRLDELYMGGSIMAEYGTRFGRRNVVDEAVRQALLMQKKTRVPETGLWRHAYDPDRKEPWADPVTGLSPECWGTVHRLGDHGSGH